MTHEPTVIVVEQIPAMREVLKAALEEGFQCRVEVRESVMNLLSSIKQMRPIPALIVLDVETPGAQRFLADLRDSPNHRAIPVIGANLRGMMTDRDVLVSGYDGSFTSDLFSLESLARKYLVARPLAQTTF